MSSLRTVFTRSARASPLQTVTRIGGRRYASTAAPPPKTSSSRRWAALRTAAFVGAGVALLVRETSASKQQQPPPAKALDEAAQREYFGRPSYGSAKDAEAAIAELRAVLPEGAITTLKEVLENQGSGQWSYLPEVAPTAVVYPSSTEEVVKIVKIADKYRIPLIPRSAGTSLEGHCSAEHGGILLDFEENMNKILAVRPDDLDATVQPGLKWVHLNEYLKEKDIPLFFPLDPSPDAAIGGMLSNGCSGTNACFYGTAKGEWFLNITAVLADGTVIKTRQRAKKSSAGFDLTKLFTGAEGTLGIITEVTLRLTPVLPVSVAVTGFKTVEEAAKVVSEVVRSGVRVNCAELLDGTAMLATNRSGLVDKEFPATPHLFFKFAGGEAQRKEDAARTAAIVKKYGGTPLEFAKTEKEAEDLWAGRKWALASAQALNSNAKVWTTDVCVPISRLPELIARIRADLDEHGVVAPIVSHAADGNVHALMLFEGDEERARVEQCVERMVDHAIALEGTCTGEHGVGKGKKHHLEHELGRTTLDTMRKIKMTLDPKYLMNPEKLYPIPGQSGHHGHSH